MSMFNPKICGSFNDYPPNTKQNKYLIIIFERECKQFLNISGTSEYISWLLTLTYLISTSYKLLTSSVLLQWLLSTERGARITTLEVEIKVG